MKRHTLYLILLISFLSVYPVAAVNRSVPMTLQKRTILDLESPKWFEVPYNTIGRIPIIDVGVSILVEGSGDDTYRAGSNYGFYFNWDSACARVLPGLSDFQWHVRRHAAMALAELKDESSVQALVKPLRSWNRV